MPRTGRRIRRFIVRSERVLDWLSQWKNTSAILVILLSCGTVIALSNVSPGLTIGNVLQTLATLALPFIFRATAGRNDKIQSKMIDLLSSMVKRMEDQRNVVTSIMIDAEKENLVNLYRTQMQTMSVVLADAQSVQFFANHLQLLEVSRLMGAVIADINRHWDMLLQGRNEYDAKANQPQRKPEDEQWLVDAVNSMIIHLNTYLHRCRNAMLVSSGMDRIS